MSIRSFLIATLTTAVTVGFFATPIDPFRGPFFREPLTGLIVAITSIALIPIGFFATCASIGYDQGKSVRAGFKGAGIGAAMLVSGAVTLYVTMFILMYLGERFHGSYEYYGRYPVLLWGPAFIGFLAPGLLVWYLDRRGYVRARKIVGTLAMMLVSGIVLLFVAVFMLLYFERNIPSNLNETLWLGACGLAITCFFTSGVIVWYLPKRGTRKGQSGNHASEQPSREGIPANTDNPHQPPES